jgi:hypothetical protein
MQKALPTAAVLFQAISNGSSPCRIQLFNPEAHGETGRLRIHVLFTNLGDTRTALRTAIGMASELESEINLIVTQIVPFPLPLDHPPVPLDFASDQVRRLAESVYTGAIELLGCIYLCRNPMETLIQKLPAH